MKARLLRYARNDGSSLADRCHVIFAALLLCLPTGCGTILDARRATLCRRALPAIAPPGAAIVLLRVGRGAAPDSVRVDYRLSGPPEAAAKARWIACDFGPDGGLDAVTTEGGAIGGASVYLLRRYYLETPEAAAADPGGG